MRRTRLWHLGAGVMSALALWTSGGLGGRIVAAAVPEAERLWIVGARAFEDGLHDVAYRELGRFTEVAPTDPRRGDATFLRGKAAFTMGRYADALEEF